EHGESDGYRFLKHVAVTLNLKTKERTQNLDALKALAREAYMWSLTNGGKKPYKFIVVDAMDTFDEWCEWQATEDYMNSVQGGGSANKAGFNRWSIEEITANGWVGKVEPNTVKERKLWQSVLTLPKGAGYMYHRNAFTSALSLLEFLADHIIYVCHIRDRYLEKDGNETTIRTASLTGQ